MKLIKRIPELNGKSIVFSAEKYDDTEAESLMGLAIEKAREILAAISDANKEGWTNNPSTGVRATFGHWLVKAMRHFAAIIVLCETQDLSVVANIHYRQIFEIFLQVRYFASLKQEEMEKYAVKISAWGCVEYLEKLEVIKDHEFIKSGYKEVRDLLTRYDEKLIEEIKEERGKRIFNWFGRNFSQLARDVSSEGEDLRSLYQIISADMHGAWDLTLNVDNPAPGVLDFRGYPDIATMYIRAIQMLDDSTRYYMKIWNEIANSVGAERVNYFAETKFS